MEIKEAVVLAAGLGTRFRGYFNEPKIFLEIKNIPLFLYPILILKSIGVRKFNIVVNEYSYDKVEKVLRKVGDLEYCMVVNKEIWRENGYSFYLTRKCVSENVFYVTMSDHLYTPDIPLTLSKCYSEGIDIVIGGDSCPKYIDVKEATKLLFTGEKLVEISKELAEYSHIDIGLFIVNKKIFNVAEKLAISKDIVKFSDILKKASQEGYSIKVCDIHGGLWTELDTIDDFKEVLEGKRSIILKKIICYLKNKGLIK